MAWGKGGVSFPQSQRIRSCREVRYAKLKKRLPYFVLSVPAIALFSVFVVTPALMGIFYSLTDWNGITRTFNMNWGRNYIQLFNDSRTFSAIGTTLLFTVVSGLIIIFVSFILALLLSRNIRFRTTMKSIYFFPAVLSLVLVGMVFYNIYSKPLPMLGQMLGSEILSRSLIAQKETALLSVIIVSIWQGVSVPLVIFLAGLQSIPNEILESAALDGANWLKKIVYITIPYMIASIQVVVVLLLRNGITTFDYVQAITGGGPGFTTETVSLLVYNNAFFKMKYSYAITQSVLLLALMVIISVIQINVLGRKDVDRK